MQQMSRDLYHSAAPGLHMCREVHQTESLHELIDVNASVFVEVDALGQVCDGVVTNLCLKMRAQEFPGLTELLERDQTWKETENYCKGIELVFRIQTELLTDLSDLCL